MLCLGLDNEVRRDEVGGILIANTGRAEEDQNVREASEGPADLRLVAAIALGLLMSSRSSPSV
jgi:hypothetical protein